MLILNILKFVINYLVKYCYLPFRPCRESPSYIAVRRFRPVSGNCPQQSDRTFQQICPARTALSTLIFQKSQSEKAINYKNQIKASKKIFKLPDTTASQDNYFVFFHFYYYYCYLFFYARYKIKSKAKIIRTVDQ